jgi:excisionase family DNA binding protein
MNGDAFAMTGRLLTARVVAEQLGVSPETVLRWARLGRLPAIHLSNRAIRFREDELRVWLEQRTASARAVAPATPNGARPKLFSVAPTATDHKE